MISAIPFEATDGKHIIKVRKRNVGTQARLSPISRNFDVQRPPFVQSKSTERGECDATIPNPVPPTIEEIRFGSVDNFFDNVPNSKAVSSPTAREDEAFHRSLDPAQEVLLMKMLKRPVMDAERISDLPDCHTPDSVKSDNQIHNGLIRRDETRDFTLNNNYRVPAKLPRFRGAPGGIKDPEEFLEIFGRNCNAHGVPIHRFPAILATCLDNFNARWFESYLGSLDGDIHWQEIATAFCNHFQNPNIAMEWLTQLRSLKMDKDGIHLYPDQFIALAHKLNWNLSDDMVIYQYKSGLSTWMLDQLSVAESNHLLSLETHSNNTVTAITVDILAKLAIRIEANKAIRRREPQHDVLSIDKQPRINKKCSFCGFNGHTYDVCRKRLAQVNQILISGGNDHRKFDGNKQNQVNKGDVAIQQGSGDANHVPTIPNNRPYRDKSSLTCFKCNKKGHIASECTSNSPSPNIKRLEVVDNVSTPLESTRQSTLIPQT